jgi:hypothetical protein
MPGKITKLTSKQGGKNVISCEGIHPYGRVAMDESPFFKV